MPESGKSNMHPNDAVVSLRDNQIKRLVKSGLPGSAVISRDGMEVGTKDEVASQRKLQTVG